MDGPAQQRLTILTHLLADELTLKEASIILELSTRKLRRVAQGPQREGAGELVHGNRGRSAVNRTDRPRRGLLLEPAETTYAGFNATHLA